MRTFRIFKDASATNQGYGRHLAGGAGLRFDKSLYWRKHRIVINYSIQLEFFSTHISTFAPTQPSPLSGLYFHLFN